MPEVEKNALVVPGRNGALLTEAALEGVLLLFDFSYQALCSHVQVILTQLSDFTPHIRVAR